MIGFNDEAEFVVGLFIEALGWSGEFGAVCSQYFFLKIFESSDAVKISKSQFFVRIITLQIIILKNQLMSDCCFSSFYLLYLSYVTKISGQISK